MQVCNIQMVGPEKFNSPSIELELIQRLAVIWAPRIDFVQTCIDKHALQVCHGTMVQG